jgi:hypothetical protein
LRRALVLVALALGCSSTASTPTAFGINVTVDAAQLAPTLRAQIVRAALSVSGDETFTTTFDVHKPIQGGRVRFRYIPKVHSGTLQLQLDALDGSGAALASGVSNPTLLVDKRAVEALITLTVGNAPDLGVGGDGAGAQLLGNGTACTQASDCQSNFCVDGVCCESDCTAACHTCGLAGAPGICNLAPSGTDPHNSCGDDGTPCGLDGTCDGTGGCRFRTIDTVCRQQSCATGTNMLTRASTCDGKGACPASVVEACAPYVCKPDGTGCFSDCVPDGGSTECQAPKTCNAGGCGPKPNGRACGGDAECQSGKCRDGFCCNVDCNTSCFACNIAGKEGTCSPTPAGTAAPAGACTNPTNDPCGATGKCDGTGKCAFPSGNICSNGSCQSTSVALKGNRCDGTGKCVAASPQTVACGKYACYTTTTSGFTESWCYSSCGGCLCLCICGSPPCGSCPPCPSYQARCSSGTCTNTCSSDSAQRCL